ncbi:dimethylaniline monooxygenase [N-oxide-forming] 2 [Aplysia californica]|uniref:Flavin-containing monooxygenase n=1 Tax=Aplysia californica TaxID=6500 RepID=A0ABM1VP43_APLCA|nr:dimethylaniline monooxygenase [N-oxide-forming] 2 [Aplysia californica]
MASQKRVCVIGAGVSGLLAIKECLAEGFLPTCYESDSDIGGTWNQSKDPAHTLTPMVWDSLVVNTPGYLTLASDFPPPPELTPYFSWKEMKSYWDRYADHFKLRPYIHLNTQVVKVRRASDHTATGRWEVNTAPHSGRSNEKTPEQVEKITTEIFDAVIVCSGYYRVPRYPSVPGMETFPGSVTHSFFHKSRHPYFGKKVLVVGCGLSAVDVAEDIARDAESTAMALGHGIWIMPRLASGGIPLLEKIPRRFFHSPHVEVLINNFKMYEGGQFLDHTGSRVRPNALPCVSPGGVSNNFQLDVMSGKIQIYSYLKRLSGRTAFFSDGSSVNEIDAIVFCTGYDTDLSMLEDNIIDENGRMELYHMVFPLDRSHNTLLFVGQMGSDIALPPVSELQARMATKVLAGKVELPPQRKMRQCVDSLNEATLRRRKRYSYFLPGFKMMENIAVDLGVYPSFCTLLLRDPMLAWRVWYGPIYSAHYRLLGPDNNWEDARRISHLAYESRGKFSHTHRTVEPLVRNDVKAARRQRAIRVFFTLVLPICASTLLYSFHCRGR